MSKKKVFAIVSIAIACILVLGIAIGLVLNIFVFAKDNKHIKNMIAKNIVEKAQYIPNMTSLFKDKNSQRLAVGFEGIDDDQSAAETKEKIVFSDDEIDKFTNTLGGLNGYAAGKHLGYTILELKEEMLYLLKTIPAFDKWVRMPYHEQIPDKKFEYMGSWAYKISYDAKSGKLSILRFCWKTRASYYDNEQDAIIEDNEAFRLDPETKKIKIDKVNGEKTYQYQTMKLDYYYENGDEVVECSVYDVMHIGNDTYPVRYEYLKNVKDKSIVRYESIIRNRFQSPEFTVDNDGFGYEVGGIYTNDGYPLQLDNEYGAKKTFLQMNYGNSDNNEGSEKDIDILMVTQNEPQQYDSRPKSAELLYFGIKADGVNIFNTAWAYANKDDINNTCGGVNIPPYEHNKFHEDDIKYLFSRIEFSTYNHNIYYNNERHDLEEPIHEGETIYKCKCFKEQDSNVTTGTYGYFFENGDETQKLNNVNNIIVSNLYTLTNNICDGDIILTTAMDLTLTDFSFQESVDTLLDATIKHAIDNFELKNNYAEYDKKQKRAAEIEISSMDQSANAAISGDAKNSKVAIEQNNLKVDGVATYDLSKIEKRKGKYFVSLVLSSINNNNKIILESCDAKVDSDGILKANYSFTKNLMDIELNNNGTYGLGIAITYGDKKGTSVLSNINLIAFQSKELISKADKPEKDGFVQRYNYFYLNNNLYINSTYIDVQAPKLEIQDTLNLKSGKSVYSIIKNAKITDNSQIENIEIFYNNEKVNYSDLLQQGDYRIDIYDDWGNVVSKVITVNLS